MNLPQSPAIVAWLAGRGLARTCGFSWEVPDKLYEAFVAGRISRGAFESRIRAELTAAQAASLAGGRIDTSPVERLLERLEQGSRPGWDHAFVTTNWNTLLDSVLARGGRTVWHLNGSIADPRCSFSTEVDVRDGEEAYVHREGVRRLLQARVCVLAGLSFASRLDRGLIERLGAERNPQHGDATWIVVNENEVDVRRTTRLLHERVPHAPVMSVWARFEDWVEADMPELRSIGVIEECNRAPPPADDILNKKKPG